jgi:hypothetical protein
VRHTECNPTHPTGKFSTKPNNTNQTKKGHTKTGLRQKCRGPRFVHTVDVSWFYFKLSQTAVLAHCCHQQRRFINVPRAHCHAPLSATFPLSQSTGEGTAGKERLQIVVDAPLNSPSPSTVGEARTSVRHNTHKQNNTNQNGPHQNGPPTTKSTNAAGRAAGRRPPPNLQISRVAAREQQRRNSASPRVIPLNFHRSAVVHQRCFIKDAAKSSFLLFHTSQRPIAARGRSSLGTCSTHRRPFKAANFFRLPLLLFPISQRPIAARGRSSLGTCSTHRRPFKAANLSCRRSTPTCAARTSTLPEI